MCTLFLDGAAEDYVAISGLVIRFETGEGRVCHNVTIIQDTLCEEPEEDFLVSLTPGSVGDPPISIINSPATVFIDDRSEDECSKI